MRFKKIVQDYAEMFPIGYPNKMRRIEQMERVADVLEKHFPFNRINCIETGCSFSWGDGAVGYCFARFAYETPDDDEGIFYSVDIDPDRTLLSTELYDELLPSYPIKHVTSDSVEFLESIPYPSVPTNEFDGTAFNLVHLDSWDLNLKDPLPSMLHGWREFDAIQDKMPVGSIIIIDDNFLQNTWVEWVTGTVSERIDITYPIVGKGAHVYQWAKREDTNWVVLDDSFIVGNVKIIVQKVRP